MPADVVNRDDVGMCETRDRQRFLFESMEPIGIAREGRRQHLDRHFPAQSRIVRAVDGSHTASAE